MNVNVRSGLLWESEWVGGVTDVDTVMSFLTVGVPGVLVVDVGVSKWSFRRLSRR